MIKANKLTCILSSLVILLPLLFGLLIWDTLPESVAIHWNISGEADGTATRTFAVIALPLILLALHWFCILATAYDHRQRKQSPKVIGMVLWIIPTISLFASGVIYAAALGAKLRMTLLGPLLVGALLIVLGNYLPKCTRNHTIGIKVKWALENEENWNATHRFAGKIWVVAGVGSLFTTLLPAVLSFIVLMLTVLAAVLLPTAYSYHYYKTH